MAEDNQQGKEQDNDDLPPLTPPVPYNEGDEKRNSESGSDDAAKKSQPGLQLPQPFIVKVEKEKKKWIDVQQIIPIIALLISITAVVLNKCSLDNTSKALAISDSTFKRNLIKDSLTSVSNRHRDSLDSIRREQDFARDTTNTGINNRVLATQQAAMQSSDKMNKKSIEVAEKSLGAQINSIKEAQTQFEVESRPIIQIRDIKIAPDSTWGGEKVTFDIVNSGRLPAKILSGEIMVFDAGSMINVDDVEKIAQKRQDVQVGIGANSSIANNGVLPVTIYTAPILNRIPGQLKLGYEALYLIANFTYNNLFEVSNKYSCSFIFKIKYYPKYNVTSSKADDVKISE